MIIKRKAGTTLYWGEALDPKDLAGTCDGWMKTVAFGDDCRHLEGGKVLVKTSASPWQRGFFTGEKFDLGPIVLTLAKVDHLGAHWDVRAPRHIRILRDDAREVRSR